LLRIFATGEWEHKVCDEQPCIWLRCLTKTQKNLPSIMIWPVVQYNPENENGSVENRLRVEEIVN